MILVSIDTDKILSPYHFITNTLYKQLLSSIPGVFPKQSISPFPSYHLISHNLRLHLPYHYHIHFTNDFIETNFLVQQISENMTRAPKIEKSETCMVCGAGNVSGKHFDVYCCRACAVFFR